MASLEILLLVVTFFVLLAIGVPIAFSIAVAATVTLLASVPALATLTTVAQRMATGLDSFTLLAIPFFIMTSTCRRITRWIGICEHYCQHVVWGHFRLSRCLCFSDWLRYGTENGEGGLR